MAHGTRSCCDCERFCYRGYIALLMPIEVLDSVLQDVSMCENGMFTVLQLNGLWKC